MQFERLKRRLTDVLSLLTVIIGKTMSRLRERAIETGFETLIRAKAD